MGVPKGKPSKYTHCLKSLSYKISFIISEDQIGILGCSQQKAFWNHTVNCF